MTHGSRAYEYSKIDSAMGYKNPLWEELVSSGKVQTVDGCKTAAEAIEAAGMDWRVSLRPLRTLDGVRVPTDGGMNCYAVVRDDIETCLGTVGKDYMPLQNDAAFEFFDAVVQDGGAKYEVAGTMEGGKKLFILANVGQLEVVPGDTIDRFLFLSSAHDGSQAVKMSFVNYRPTCWNALGGMMQSQDNTNGKVFRAVHTQNVLGKVRDAQDILGMIHREEQQVGELYMAMSHIYPDIEQVEEVLRNLFPADEESDRSINMAVNKRDAVLDLFQHSETCCLDTDAEGSLWGLYNAVTEWDQHHKREGLSLDERFDSQLFGSSQQFERQAFQQIVQLVY